jgi:hypothetical protein
MAQGLERLLEVHPRLVEDAALLVEALLRLVEPRVRVGALATLGRDLASHAVELERSLAELAPELVSPSLQLADPDVARPPLGLVTRREIRPGGEPRDARAQDEPDDHQHRFKHAARPSLASAGRPS